ncbi:MAG: hypothetical protein NVSMB65_22420 [Chloroflexota bacterium]
MHHRPPTVWDDPCAEGARLDSGLRLDTPAWTAWLDDPTTLSFSFPIANVTAGYSEGLLTGRKEGRTRGGVYWSAYWRPGRRLRKVYLGPASAVTTACLRAVAAALLAERQVTPAAAERAPPPVLV